MANGTESPAAMKQPAIFDSTCWGVFLAVLAAGVAAAGAGVALSSKVAEQKQKREVKKLVKREVKKAVKARQPAGISFNLFS